MFGYSFLSIDCRSFIVSCFICYSYSAKYPGVDHNFHIPRQMALVLQELHTLPAHLSFCRVRVAQSFGFDFVDHCCCVMCFFTKQLYCLVFTEFTTIGAVQLTHDHDHDGLLMSKIQ